MQVNLLCGPAIGSKDTCTYGSVVYSQTFTRAGSPPPPPTPGVTTSLTDGVTSVQAGNNVTYQAKVSSPSTSSGAAGVTLTAAIPSNASIVDAGGGTIGAGTVTWNVGTLTPGQTVTETLTLQATSGTSLTVTAQTATTDTACTNAGSTCSASDIDTVGSPPPPFKQWVGNPGVESDLTGWMGKYGAQRRGHGHPRHDHRPHRRRQHQGRRAHRREEPFQRLQRQPALGPVDRRRRPSTPSPPGSIRRSSASRSP